MMIFATIFGIGFAVLVLSFIFGGDGDVDADVHAEVGHDTGHGPSVFSVKMIALILVGFGAVGFGFRASTEWTMFQSSMAGVGGAAVVGIIGYFILRMFYASQYSSTISDEDIIGQAANLIDSIDKGSNGQVACVIRGREITFLARTGDKSSLKKGTPVKILNKVGNVVTVEEIK